MNISSWVFCLVGAASLAACHRHESAGSASGSESAAAESAIGSLTVAQVANKLSTHEPLSIYDANSHDTYEQGHVPGARWIAFNEVQASDLPPDHDTPLMFYCHNEH